MASPNPSATGDNELFGVACTGSTACIAVGRSNASTLIESWNGHVWSIVPSRNPSPSRGSLLLGVACTAPTTCTAVGFATPSNDQTLIETSPVVVHTPNIFSVALKSCTTIHIGYNYFPVGTVVNWYVNQTGTGRLQSGSITTVAPTGKTYHFLNLTTTLTLHSGLHTHVYLNWTMNGVTTRIVLIRGPACS